MAVRELKLEGLGVPPYSVREVQEDLAPIGQATAQRRTINGRKRNVAASQFQLYAWAVSCEDQQAPAVDGKWPGLVITVDCVTELVFLTASGSPARPVVPGSQRTEGDFTFYRPQLTIMLDGFAIHTDDWGAIVGWSMSGEELEPEAESA